MTRRSAARLAAALAAALVLAGCGGGGGGGGDDTAAANTPPTTPATAPAAGVSAVPVDTLFGTPDAAAPDQAARMLPGTDKFGTRDAFEQLVKENDGNQSPTEPVTGTTPTAPTTPPTTTAPTAPVTPPINPTNPTTPPGTPNPETPVATLLEADFDIGGEPVVARAGDAIPPDTQQFTVEKIAPARVTLKLNGGLLPNGQDTVDLAEGGSITLYNQTTRTSYKIRLLDIRKV